MDWLLLLFIIFSLSSIRETRGETLLINYRLHFNKYYLFICVQALTAPQHVSAEIVEDAVEISWEHTQTDKSFRGYYIMVKDVGTNEKENPVYVHVDSDAQSARIIGLRPGTTYQLMASTYRNIIYFMIINFQSRFLLIPLILIKLVVQSLSTQRNLVCTCTCNMVFSMTKNKVRMAISNSFLAAFLHVETINVSNVSNVSANFDWTHIAKNNIHHIKFKVSTTIICTCTIGRLYRKICCSFSVWGSRHSHGMEN